MNGDVRGLVRVREKKKGGEGWEGKEGGEGGRWLKQVGFGALVK